MSTRATYQFAATDWRPAVTLYIHHDGYEEGAAYYMYRASQAGGMSAEAMIRGNDCAEITESHEAHGDTKYRYTFEGNRLTVHKTYGEDWRAVYCGDWVEFVNKNINPAWFDEPIQKLKRVKVSEYGLEEIHTPKSLKDKLAGELQTLGMWTLGAYKDSPDSANMRGLKERINLMQRELAEFGPPEWKSAA